MPDLDATAGPATRSRCVQITAAPCVVIWGVGGASQQSRRGLLDGRLFCIFIHRHLWGECPHLPPTGRAASILARNLSEPMYEFRRA